MQPFSVTYDICNPDATYNESPQSRPCRFAYVKVDENNVTVLHKPVLCRDYLLDTFLWKKKVFPVEEVYGYDFCGDFTEGYLWIDKLKAVDKNLPQLWELEDKYYIHRTIYYPCTEGFLFKGSDFWWKNTIHLSVWTWLLRNFLYCDPINTGVIYSPKDERALTIHECMERIISWKVDKLHGLKHGMKETFYHSKTIHSHVGFMSQFTYHGYGITEYGN